MIKIIQNKYHSVEILVAKMGGLTIFKKNPCNSIGSIANKGTKPPLIKLDSNRIAVSYEDIGIVILRPSIDRLIFSFVPDEKLLKLYDPSVTLDEYKSQIKCDLAGNAFYPDKTGLSYIEGVSFLKPPFSLYDLNLIFKACPSSEPIIIQVSPKKGGYGYIRFDMNPNRITTKGIKNFWELIDTILLLPSGSMSREHFRIWSKIYSLEVAVDILGVRPSEVRVQSITNSQLVPQKSHIYKSKTGRAQTKYPKAKSGKSDTEYLYDKRTELMDTGKQPLYGEFLHSRFEARIGKTSFYKLEKVKNRCGRVFLHAICYQQLAKLKHNQNIFVRFSFERTVEKVLEIIPVKHRESYKRAYDKCVYPIWDAKKIWSYWPYTLKQSGLFLD